MNHFPAHSFSDPNERLLASVMPAPPSPFGVRMRQQLARALQSVGARWHHGLRLSADSLPLLLVGLGSFGVGIGLYLGVALRPSPAPVAIAYASRHAAADGAPRSGPSSSVAALVPIPCATAVSTQPVALDDASPQRLRPPAIAPRGSSRAGVVPERTARKAAKRSRTFEKKKPKPRSSQARAVRGIRARAASASTRRAARPRAANAAGG